MGRHITSTCLASLMMVALFFTMSITSEAQSASCAQELIPCADHLNSTNPPSSCCEPLKKTVETQLTCLCDLFYSPGLLQSFNININQALELSRRCGVTSDLSSCKNHDGSAPPPSTGGPPAAHEGGDKGASTRVSFTGVSFLFLLLLGASMLFN